jgi:type II secretory pathway pseudopilin PulG
MKARNSRSRSQAGYFLLSVMLLVTVMLIFLAAELPRVTQQIQRAREEELVNRGMEYAKAVKKYRRKMGNFPNSIDQLMDTNHIRFLRKRYKDPMTGEDDWKIVHLGEAEIQLPKGNNPGLAGSGDPGLKGGTLGGGPNPNPSPTPDGRTGLNPSSGNQGGNLGSLQVSNPGGGQTLGGPGMIGVVSTSKKSGIKEFHDSNRYDEWLFVYDPRLEQAAGANGGGTAGITVAAPRAGGGGGGGSSGGAVGSGPAPGTFNQPPGNPPAGNPPEGSNPPPGNLPPGNAPQTNPPAGAAPPPTGSPTPSPTPQ